MKKKQKKLFFILKLIRFQNIFVAQLLWAAEVESLKIALTSNHPLLQEQVTSTAKKSFLLSIF
jgi:hypothetical protein